MGVMRGGMENLPIEIMEIILAKVASYSAGALWSAKLTSVKALRRVFYFFCRFFESSVLELLTVKNTGANGSCYWGIANMFFGQWILIRWILFLIGSLLAMRSWILLKNVWMLIIQNACIMRQLWVLQI